MKKNLFFKALLPILLLTTVQFTAWGAASSSAAHRFPSYTHRHAARGDLKALTAEGNKADLANNINVQDQNGRTPLILAAMNGHNAVVRHLLANEANPTIADNALPEDAAYFADGGNTALHWVAKRLVDKRRNEDGSRKFDPEIYYDIALSLLENPLVQQSVDTPNAAGATILHILAGQHRLRKPRQDRVPAPQETEVVHRPEDIAKEKENLQSLILLGSLIFNQHANINAQDIHGLTPLHWAAAEVLPKTAYELIVHGADVSIRDKDNKTPLHWASLKGHHDLIGDLLIYGRDQGKIRSIINQKDDRGRTPLQWVARQMAGGTWYGSGYHIPKEYARRVMKSLVSFGADPSIRDKDGKTVADWMREKQGEVFDFLIVDEPAAPAAASSSSSGMPAATAASSSSAAAPIEILFNAIDDFNHDVAQVGELLNTYPGLANAANRYGTKPLNFIASMGPGYFNDESREDFLQISRFLMAEGAKKNGTDASGKTPLQSAIEMHNDAMVKLLLDKGADIRLTDAQGQLLTNKALTSAQKQPIDNRVGNLKVIMQLLNTAFERPRGSERTTPSPTHVAAATFIPSSFTTPASASTIFPAAPVASSSSSSSRSPQWVWHPNRINNLLRRNQIGSLSTPDKNGQPALHVAIRNNWIPLATQLIQRGVNTNTTNRNGLLPLHVAAKFGRSQLIPFLATQENVNALDNFNHTPLYKALFWKHNGPGAQLAGPKNSAPVVLNMVQQLMRAGAHPNVRSKRKAHDGSMIDETPLQMAQKFGWHRIAQLLRPAPLRKRVRALPPPPLPRDIPTAAVRPLPPPPLPRDIPTTAVRPLPPPPLPRDTAPQKPRRPQPPRL